MSPKPRYRLQFKFWLNLKADKERRVADIIELLKNERSFTRAIVDGLLLMWDLRQGRADVLLDLFPNVVDWLQFKLTPPPDTSKLEAKIDRLEKILLERGIDIPGSDLWMVPPATKPGRALPPKPVNTAIVQLPEDDGQSSANLLDSFL